MPLRGQPAAIKNGFPNLLIFVFFGLSWPFSANETLARIDLHETWEVVSRGKRKNVFKLFIRRRAAPPRCSQSYDLLDSQNRHTSYATAFSMPSFEPLSHLDSDGSIHRLPDSAWLPVLQHVCSFPPLVFQAISLNLIKNPNINSNLLFRADILYDSTKDELAALEPSQRAALQQYRLRDGAFPGFEVIRTLVRLMIPRNPQLDKPIAQTCQVLTSKRGREQEENLVVYVPHASRVEELPWYHPRVQSLAYLHTWRPQRTTPSTFTSEISCGDISLHYLLYPSESLPLSERLMRTGHHLLSTLHKHGQGELAGYKKRVHHDQLISQQRVQDTYTELKRKHAKRLCDNWVEQTEPSKHVFEDLGIAAFLIELWKDMYEEEDKGSSAEGGRHDSPVQKPKFPGFVDIGCGNGVLVDVLLREGYEGWGFDARRRKTWSTFEPSIQKNLKQLLLIPQPLFETHSPINDADGGILRQDLTLLKLNNKTKKCPKEAIWHNGIFPTGTFIISNHADELTPWTPLLASISSSPFLAIPCCSHNLSGARFRAPSVFNSYSADHHAPTFFAANVTRSKSVAIKIACTTLVESSPSSPLTPSPSSSRSSSFFSSSSLSYPSPQQQQHRSEEEEKKTPFDDDDDDKQNNPSRGDLKSLSQTARAKNPSAYASLCDWVSHLADSVGYVVEKEMLRLPSTRNMGIVCRTYKLDAVNNNDDDTFSTATTTIEKMERVKRIVSKEGADGKRWVDRARGLVNPSTTGAGAGGGNKGQ